jgi:hypothetical protein
MLRVPDPGQFQFNLDYLDSFSKYYLYLLLKKMARLFSLLLVILVVIVASLFKNGFIFLANNSMAYISALSRICARKCMIKFSNCLYHFTDAGKVM